MSEKMLYLSNSIDDKSSDVIGFDTYVNKLDDAIEEGAQMIAVTSPFGSGKTSIIELLRKKRVKRKREKFLNVQMWSQLNTTEHQEKSSELHRNFLYQIGSAISPRKGTYINRRLSNNYGLLKLHVNKSSYWAYLIFAIFCAVIGWFAKEHSDVAIALLPKIEGIIKYVPFIMSGISIVLLIIVITGAEIIFSSKNSENQRKIEADEIIDLYRNEIINKRSKVISLLCHWLKKIPIIKKIPLLNGKSFIIIVEDLDRTDDNEAVIHFLKELRKYYVLVDDNEYKNRVVFIVNIKPETSIVKSATKIETPFDKEEIGDDVNSLSKNGASLYAKLFDYVINVQTINILDYNTILCALLQEKKTQLDQYGLKSSTDQLSDIPGMQWMIRGQHLDIREIKKRLNSAIVIFETLRERYPEKKESVNFEKCAVAAYLTIEFEADFGQTPNKAFGSLIEMNLQKKTSIEQVKKILSTQNDEYADVVNDLILSKLIGQDYRLYFYNYPKNSVMYTNDELMVQNAILYGTQYEAIESIAKKVVDSGSDVVGASFKKLRQLKLPLPQLAIKTECLFLAAIQFEYEFVLEMFSKINSDDASLDKNISNIMSILNYDLERKIYTPKIFEDFCTVWENILDEKYILSLRESLCSRFGNEITAYKQLFLGDHNVISQKEMDKLIFDDCLELLNVDSNNFSVSHVKYIVDRFVNSSDTTDVLSQKILNILNRSCDKFGDSIVAEYLLDYMLKRGGIVPEFENRVYKLLTLGEEDLEDIDLDSKWQNGIFKKYKKLVNSISRECFSTEVLLHINNLDSLEDPYDYSLQVANMLYDNGYYLTSTFIKLQNNEEIDFEDDKIIEGFKNNLEWLIEHNKELLLARRAVLIKSNKINEYLFLFSSDFPIVSKEEFLLLVQNKDVNFKNVLSFFPAKNMNTDAVEYVSKYFNERYRNNNDAFDVLMSLIKYDEDIILLFFEKINFQTSFLYYNFAADKKAMIKKKFVDALQLDTYAGMLRFMELTRFLDEAMEEQLLDQMDSDMEKKYINVVRKKLAPNQIKMSTIQNLTSFNTYYSFSDRVGVNQKLLEQKEFLYYVLSTTAHNKRFAMVSDEMIDELWPTYMELFSNPNKYSQTVGYMKENQDFLVKVVCKEAYKDIPDASLEMLAIVQQDENLIAHAFARGNAFAVKYLSLIKSGFVDRGAAKMFVEQIALPSNMNVAKNNSVRENVYDMLIDPGLKSKYTKTRKSYGCDY